ncbi:uncharacterized protein Z518_08801 [Rhinocladiella mackenziei CBS 650.93]|uniref:Rhinocladiella mackenziei CBS 650.93 unplaced genomic scaffold supercont1.6, whole genome shotgun sequence n=1 Tax=Rhinocladiella mackenziei CBS 650.93 TaxID=1442369 RepID=A0A0D2GXF1_9EURO|nr:uncharacterized protein Z518_08801 [Rhinocladiella mackenziei CBS 650.93]KIX02858.1 hypothetical protein Z518_08801 [Rhinocladiella mackenziei CBS 650.93]
MGALEASTFVPLFILLPQQADATERPNRPTTKASTTQTISFYTFSIGGRFEDQSFHMASQQEGSNSPRTPGDWTSVPSDGESEPFSNSSSLDELFEEHRLHLTVNPLDPFIPTLAEQHRSPPRAIYSEPSIYMFSTSAIVQEPSMDVSPPPYQDFDSNFVIDVDRLANLETGLKFISNEQIDWEDNFNLMSDSFFDEVFNTGDYIDLDPDDGQESTMKTNGPGTISEPALVEEPASRTAQTSGREQSIISENGLDIEFDNWSQEFLNMDQQSLADWAQMIDVNLDLLTDLTEPGMFVCNRPPSSQPQPAMNTYQKSSFENPISSLSKASEQGSSSDSSTQPLSPPGFVILGSFLSSESRLGQSQSQPLMFSSFQSSALGRPCSPKYVQPSSNALAQSADASQFDLPPLDFSDIPVVDLVAPESSPSSRSVTLTPGPTATPTTPRSDIPVSKSLNATEHRRRLREDSFSRSRENRLAPCRQDRRRHQKSENMRKELTSASSSHGPGQVRMQHSSASPPPVPRSTRSTLHVNKRFDNFQDKGKHKVEEDISSPNNNSKRALYRVIRDGQVIGYFHEFRCDRSDIIIQNGRVFREVQTHKGILPSPRSVSNAISISTSAGPSRRSERLQMPPQSTASSAGLSGCSGRLRLPAQSNYKSKLRPRDGHRYSDTGMNE